MTGFEFLDSLPTIDDFKNEAELPRSQPVAGIYLLQNESGVAYVGQSSDVRRRLCQHRTEAKKRFTMALWYQVEDEVSRLRMEAILTLAIWPQYNDAVLIGLRNPVTGGRRCWEWDRARIYRRKRK